MSRFSLSSNDFYVLNVNVQIFFKYNNSKIENIGEHRTSGDAITSLDIHPEVCHLISLVMYLPKAIGKCGTLCGH